MDSALDNLAKSLKGAYDAMDTNKDGRLTKEEIKACLKDLEADISEEKLNDTIATCNPSGGDVSFDQVMKKTPDILMKIMLFLAMDTNHDKRINFAEFKTMTDMVAGEITNDPQLDALFKQLDKNHDGLISLSEMLDFN